MERREPQRRGRMLDATWPVKRICPDLHVAGLDLVLLDTSQLPNLTRERERDELLVIGITGHFIVSYNFNYIIVTGTQVT